MQPPSRGHPNGTRANVFNQGVFIYQFGIQEYEEKMIPGNCFI